MQTVDEEGDEMTIEFLEDLRRLVLSIYKDEGKVESLKSKVTSPQGLNTDVKVQSSGYKQDALMAVLCDMEARLQDKIAEAERMSAEAEIIYEAFGEDGEMMRYRFSCGCTWEEVSELMHYDSRTVYRRWMRVRRRLR